MHRFPNDRSGQPTGCTGTSSSSIANVLIGLRKAIEQRPDSSSIGIDSWAVDYGLFARRAG